MMLRKPRDNNNTKMGGKFGGKPGKPGDKKGGKMLRVFKKKACKLCKGKVKAVDYKDVEFLKYQISDRGKIVPSRISGNCAKHQRMVSKGIKRARIMGLLPFVKIKEGVRRESNTFRRRG